MSKRSAKKGKRPNLPQSTLERARRQAAGEDIANEAEAVGEDTSQTDEIAQARAEQQRSIRERKRVQNKQTDAGETGHDYMREMLKNPVKEITEEDMRAEYGHVVVDLRNMALLAAALLVLLVFLAQVF